MRSGIGSRTDHGHITAGVAELEKSWQRGVLDLDSVCRAHCHIFLPHRPALAGALRQGPSVVQLDGRAHHFPPPADEAIELTRDLLSSLAADLRGVKEPAHPTNISLAGYAAARLTELHPFCDGNGRMARILAGWVLARGGMIIRPDADLAGEFHRDRLRYFTALRNYDAEPEQWSAMFGEAVRTCFEQPRLAAGRSHPCSSSRA